MHGIMAGNRNHHRRGHIDLDRGELSRDDLTVLSSALPAHLVHYPRRFLFPSSLGKHHHKNFIFVSHRALCSDLLSKKTQLVLLSRKAMAVT